MVGNSKAIHANRSKKMINVEEILKPETELEKQIVRNQKFIFGALYGKPRNGHPEGQVVFHIREVLDNVEKYCTKENRTELRLIALIHDTFKNGVDNTKPKVGENHHAMIARRFAESFHLNEDVLDVIELHDEAYNAWSVGDRSDRWVVAEKRLEKLLLRLTDQNYQLYRTFYRCDNETGNKTQANFEWFCKYVGG